MPPANQPSAKMPPANEPSNVGLIFDAIAKDAWDSFLKDDHERAQRLARQLLKQPRLGNVLKAAMHMIMATGSDDYMFHATQAAQLYEHLFDNIENPPIANRRWREIALDHARELQEKAKEDQLAFQNHIKTHYGSPDAAEDGLIKRFGEQADKLFEQEEAFLNSETEDEAEDKVDNNNERREAELADNPYLDTEYPMPDPNEVSVAPADYPYGHLTLAELLKKGR